MNTELYAHESAHLSGEPATRPMALPWDALAALPVLDGVQFAAAGAFARSPHDSTLGRVQLPLPG